jgi:hypothetical protein
MCQDIENRIVYPYAPGFVFAASVVSINRH